MNLARLLNLELALGGRRGGGTGFSGAAPDVAVTAEVAVEAAPAGRASRRLAAGARPGRRSAAVARRSAAAARPWVGLVRPGGAGPPPLQASSAQGARSERPVGSRARLYSHVGTGQHGGQQFAVTNAGHHGDSDENRDNSVPG